MSLGIKSFPSDIARMEITKHLKQLLSKSQQDHQGH